jgi:hypothetical protein
LIWGRNQKIADGNQQQPERRMIDAAKFHAGSAGVAGSPKLPSKEFAGLVFDGPIVVASFTSNASHLGRPVSGFETTWSFQLRIKMEKPPGIFPAARLICCLIETSAHEQSPRGHACIQRQQQGHGVMYAESFIRI